MSVSCGKRSMTGRRGERGEGRLKFLVTIGLLAILAYAGYQYIPIEFKAYQFKVLMQDTVDKAVALGKNGEWVKTQLTGNLSEYSVPTDATITTTQRDGRLEARVQFKQPISLPFYNQYNFDHTVKSTDLLNIR